MAVTIEKLKLILRGEYEDDPSFIATEEDYWAEVENGLPFRISRYGLEEIDASIPFKSGQLTLIVGHSNIGKSTTIIFLLFMLAKTSGLKFVIYSSENRISAIVRRLLIYWAGKPWPNITDTEKADGKKWVREHFRFILHIRMYTYKQLLNMGAITLESGFDFDAMMIDPYNSLKVELKGLQKHDYNIQACEEMRVFCEATGKSIFLNTHTTTEAQRARDDKDKSKTPRPLYTDVEGGAPFANKADDVIVLHRHVRDGDSFMITEMYVDKVREQEYGGKITAYHSPIQLRFRKDRTAFDVMGSFEEKVQSVKETNEHINKHMGYPPPNFVPLEEAKKRKNQQPLF